MLNPRKAQYFPDGISMFVPELHYHSDVGTDGISRPYISPPSAAGAATILSAQDVAAANANGTSSFVASFNKDVMAEYGRAVAVILSGVGTPTITVRGRDYLGQPMVETIVAAGAVSVAGKKAFKYIDNVSWTAAGAGITMNLGTLDIFGIPYLADALLQENVSNAVPANPGTFVPGVKTDPATAVTGDTRGTYAPNAANAANGVRSYRLVVQCDKDKLHGVRHFS